MLCWDIKNQNKVLCAILHVDYTSIAWAFGLRNLIIPGQVTGISGMPYDDARNMACRVALEQGFEWLYFLDSDVIPPRDAVLRLLARNKPIISGLYCRRSPPAAIPVMIKDRNWVTNYVPGSLVEVDYVGAGCLLIHRSVLENMPAQEPGHHWFNWRVNMVGIGEPGECLSEDFTFGVHAKKTLGISTIVDTSVVCQHVGLAQARHGVFEPCLANPNT